jgi:hypothetical protein
MDNDIFCTVNFFNMVFSFVQRLLIYRFRDVHIAISMVQCACALVQVEFGQFFSTQSTDSRLEWFFFPERADLLLSYDIAKNNG